MGLGWQKPPDLCPFPSPGLVFECMFSLPRSSSRQSIQLPLHQCFKLLWPTRCFVSTLLLQPLRYCNVLWWTLGVWTLRSKWVSLPWCKLTHAVQKSWGCQRPFALVLGTLYYLHYQWSEWRCYSFLIVPILSHRESEAVVICKPLED